MAPAGFSFTPPESPRPGSAIGAYRFVNVLVLPPCFANNGTGFCGGCCGVSGVVPSEPAAAAPSSGAPFSCGFIFRSISSLGVVVCAGALTEVRGNGVVDPKSQLAIVTTPVRTDLPSDKSDAS